MANPSVTRIAGFRIVADRRELAARRPAWTVEGPDGLSTDLCWSRSAAVVAGRKLWPALDAALVAAGL